MSLTRAVPRALAVIASAIAAAALLPSLASASPYEQVNRATGPLGASSPWEVADGTAVGDVGRYAGFTKRVWNGLDYTPVAAVRDIQTNTTIDYGGNVQAVFSFDRAEQRALILRTRAGQQQVVAVPIGGVGTPIIVSQEPVSTTPQVAVLSGDGRKAIVASRTTGTTVYDLTGGVVHAIRSYPTLQNVAFPPRAVNDLGTVFVAEDQDTSQLVLVRGTTKTVLTGAGYEASAAIDPSGTTLAWSSFDTLYLRNLATSSERHWPLLTPDAGNPGVAWVADGGSKVIVAPRNISPNSVARSFVPGTTTASAGTWARFGDRFATTLLIDPISESGRFAVVGGSGTGQPGVSLVDLTGAHIVGANEGLAPAAYIRAGSFVQTCNTPADFGVGMIAVPYAPAPVKAVVTAKVDGAVIATGTITHALPSDSPGPPPEGEAGWTVSGSYIPGGHGPVKLTATVTDGSGRVLTDAWTEPDEYCAN